MYTFDSRVRYSELNDQGSLRYSSIINYFQDCSTFQSEDINRGLDYWNSVKKHWLLNSWQIEINRLAELGEYITIGTWAHDFKGIYGYRNFIIRDSNDQVITAANSVWVYIDTKQGRPTRIPEHHEGYESEPPYPMNYAVRKISLPQQLSSYPSFTVKRSMIDTYNHVNNGQYIKMAEEFIPDNFIVTQIRVEYRKSAMYNDIIVPKISITSNCTTVVLSSLEENVFAIVEFSNSKES